MADYPRPPWVAQIPWVVAMDKGWYKAAGLDVKYVFPSTPSDPARFIGIGRADVTVSYTPDLLTAAGKGLKVKALASVFDRNVEGIMVWKDSGITTPKQLEGHTVAVYDFPMAKLNWQTFAAALRDRPEEGQDRLRGQLRRAADGLEQGRRHRCRRAERARRLRAAGQEEGQVLGLPEAERDPGLLLVRARRQQRLGAEEPGGRQGVRVGDDEGRQVVVPAPEGSRRHLRQDVQEGRLAGARAARPGRRSSSTTRRASTRRSRPAGWIRRSGRATSSSSSRRSSSPTR